MSQLHAAAGAVVLGTSAVFALVALGAATLDRAPWWLDRIRLALTGLAVVAAAIEGSSGSTLTCRPVR